MSGIDKELWKAAERGDKETVSICLAANADVNFKHLFGYTPLHKAAGNGHTSTCRLLLDAGANVNERNTTDYTPLHEAVINSNTFTCSLLLDAGANVNKRNGYGDTPLHLAALNGDPPMCQILLDAGARVNESDNDGDLPLHLAAKKGDLPMCQLLLDTGTQVNESNNDGATPLHLAALNGDPPMCQLLLDAGARVNESDNDGDLAAKKGDLSKCQLLLDTGTHVNESNNENFMAEDKTVQKELHLKESDLIYKQFLGKGATGEVHKVIFKNIQSPREAAAKKIRISRHGKIEEQIGIEVDLLKSCDHKNLVKFFGQIITSSEVIILMEYATKGSLNECLKTINPERLPTYSVCQWGIDLAEAIKYLHTKGEKKVVHRDVKSPNCLIFENDTLKLCDFGIARVIDKTTYTNSEKGSAKWLAPELIEDGIISTKSDIFAFGIVLWELETCEEPYKGMKSYSVTYSVASKGLRPVIPEDCPEELQDIMRDCWTAKYTKRPDIDDIIKRLSSLKHDRSPHHRSVQPALLPTNDGFGGAAIDKGLYSSTRRPCLDVDESYKDLAREGDTPLHLAVKKGDRLTCQLLLDAGAHVDKSNNDGDTPFHLAARKSNAAISKMLIIDFKADTTIINHEGKVALDCWPQRGFFQPKDADYLEVGRAIKDAKFKLLMEAGGRAVDTVKLFIIGDPATGKTSLQKSLSRGLFGYIFGEIVKFTDERIPTPGIEVTGKHVKGAGSFMIWDSAGQMEFRVTHAMLLGSSRGIFIITSKCLDPDQRQQLLYWLSFIKAGKDPSDGERKQFIVLVGTHMDECRYTAEETEVAKQTVQELKNSFGEYLDIHDEMILVDSRRSRSKELRSLKHVLDKLAKPLRGDLMPNICDEITKRKSGWGKGKVPVLFLPEFLEKVRSEIDRLASDTFLETALWYLHHTGEIHRARSKSKDQRDIIILEPNWLTTNIFGPIFADPDFRRDYKGLEPKQEYTLDDLKYHFKSIDPDLLVQLLVYFELAYRNDDKVTFIIPAKLPLGVEIHWLYHEKYINFFGIRIECRDVTDMFSVDTFPCLQVSCMNRYRQECIKPLLSRFGLKVFDEVEGMIQLTKDKRAIHAAVRVEKDLEKEGVAQLEEMKSLISQQLTQRSIGTNIKISYLSPNDLQASKDLIENVHYYSEEAVERAEVTWKALVNPRTLIRDRIEDIKGVTEQRQVTKKDPIRSILDEATDILCDSLNPLKILHSLTTKHVLSDDDTQDINSKPRESERVSRLLEILKRKEPSAYYAFMESLQEVRSDLFDEVKMIEEKYSLESAHVQGATGGDEPIAHLTNDTLQYLATKLGKEWKQVAVCLQISQEKVKALEDRYFSVEEQTFHMLKTWRDNQASTKEVLKDLQCALEYVKRQDLVQYLKQE